MPRRQVIEDIHWNYFRIYDSKIPGRRSYLDMNDNVPNNKVLENGKQSGRN